TFTSFNAIIHPSPPTANWPSQVELESSAAPRQGGQKATLTFIPCKEFIHCKEFISPSRFVILSDRSAAKGVEGPAFAFRSLIDPAQMYETFLGAPP
ncbi:MAG: hypothetical protein ABSE99_14110, partial [Terracidiphilus sp.]